MTTVPKKKEMSGAEATMILGLLGLGILAVLFLVSLTIGFGLEAGRISAQEKYYDDSNQNPGNSNDVVITVPEL